MPARQFKALTLDNIAEGAIIDLFDYEWKRILNDIADTTKVAKTKSDAGPNRWRRR